jgi:hypothetical protein
MVIPVYLDAAQRAGWRVLQAWVVGEEVAVVVRVPPGCDAGVIDGCGLR